MAGDWIKMRISLPRDPRVFAIADFLENNAEFQGWIGAAVPRHVTVSVTVTALLTLWGVANETGEASGRDVLLRFATIPSIDDITGIPGFGEAIISVSWGDQIEDGLVLYRFLKHNALAKEREGSSGAERQRRYRERLKHQNGDVTLPVNGDVTVTVEKRREEKNKKTEESTHPPTPQIPASVSFSSDGLKALHESFCAVTGNAVDLTPQRQRSWTDFVRRGFTESDFKRVVFWIRQRMNAGEGGLSEQSLTFRVLIGDIDKFEERLGLAKKTGLGAGPAIPAKEPPDWRDWALTKYPGARLPGSFWGLDGSVQREFREERPELGWKGANFVGEAAP